MSALFPEFNMATRGSSLAILQAREAVRGVRGRLPEARFRLLAIDTPGDRDKTTDLRRSDPDFFTRDLHAAVLDGRADCAVHSAKDLEEMPPPDVDWFWLPAPADPRDALVTRTGVCPEALPDGGIAGVSSDRREEYFRRYWPRLRIRSIRGTIEERLAQLDAGAYDVLGMAAAALDRLGMRDRIARRIPAEELTPPEGQGCLAMTFRAGDERFLRLRGLFVKPVVFAGAGCGSSDACTLGALHALARCEVCIHDSLLDKGLLDRLPAGAQRVNAGKRRGAHTLDQPAINSLLAAAARRGRRVVRLKGGDPGVFGRLSEETETLDALRLTYRVIPGVSSLVAATTGTGLLLTRRGVSRGFAVITPRRQGGACAPVNAAARAALPIAFFMGTDVLGDIVAQLRADGFSGQTPAAIVFQAGSADETILRGSLDDIEARLACRDPAPGAPDANPETGPGLILVGEALSRCRRVEWGALMGRRVLLTCSAALQAKAADAVRDFGGIPVSLPLIRMLPDSACIRVLKTLPEFDWLAITSPSCVHMLMRVLPETGLDVRAVPKILAAGPGTAAALKGYGMTADVEPDAGFGAEGMLAATGRSLPPGAAILRVRSQLAGGGLARSLTAAGHRVTDCVLYRNEFTRPERIPAFEAVFFASASAVTAFMESWSGEALAGKAVAALGGPTMAMLEKYGIRSARMPTEATAEAAIMTLAAAMAAEAMEKRI